MLGLKLNHVSERGPKQPCWDAGSISYHSLQLIANHMNIGYEQANLTVLDLQAKTHICKCQNEDLRTRVPEAYIKDRDD